MSFAAIAVALALLLSACGNDLPQKTAPPSSSPTPTLECPSPEPTATVTVTMGAAPERSPSPSVPEPCPTATATVRVALHHSGDTCTTIGDKYLAVDPALLCFRNEKGKALWLTAAQVRKAQAAITAAKAEASRKKAEAEETARKNAAAEETARQKAAEEELNKAAEEAQQPTQQKPNYLVPQAPKNDPAPVQQAPSASYYPNCAAARAAGAAPIYAGQPGYRAGLDRDGDGIACE